MKPSLKNIDGSIVAPQGFRASGVFCDIKRLGTGKGSEKGHEARPGADSSRKCRRTVAGLFTTNQVCAAPVKVCLSAVKQGRGPGDRGQLRQCQRLHGAQGRQGRAAKWPRFAERAFHLPRGRSWSARPDASGCTCRWTTSEPGFIEAAIELGIQPEHAAQAAEAIMTSDTRAKQIAVEFKLGGRTVRIGGICKGAGMIQPGMSATGERPAARPLHATMLCFLTTDAAIERAARSRPPCRKPWRKASIASPSTAT